MMTQVLIFSIRFSPISNFQTFFMAASLSSSTLLFCSVLHPFCGEKRKRNISTFTEKQHISKKKDLKAKFHPFQISRPMSVSMLSSEKQLGLSNNGPLLLPLLLLHITTATTTTTTSTTTNTTTSTSIITATTTTTTTNANTTITTTIRYEFILYFTYFYFS